MASGTDTKTSTAGSRSNARSCTSGSAYDSTDSLATVIGIAGYAAVALGHCRGVGGWYIQA